MKLFLTRAVGFLLLQALIFTAFWNHRLPHENGYIGAVLDKHERLERTRSPRVILIGGSNLAFGIKSKTLETELGRPVVNMSLHCRFGIDLMLDEIENAIRPGDLVVLSFEYDIFSSPASDNIVTTLLEVRPESFSLVPQDQLMRLIEERGFAILGGIARRSMLQRFETPEPVDPLAPPGEGNYKRNLFDPQGSYLGHYGLTAPNAEFHMAKVTPMSVEILSHLERFAKRCQNLGAQFVYSCPPYPEPLLRPVLADVETNLARLKRIPGLIVVDSPLDHGYPRDLFYDTPYHLGEAGAEQRTRKLAKALAPVLQQERGPLLTGAH